MLAWIRPLAHVMDKLLEWIAIPTTTLGWATAAFFLVLTYVSWTQARRKLRSLVTWCIQWLGWRALVAVVFVAMYNMAMRPASQRWLARLADEILQHRDPDEDTWS
jgi:hypothetical protein